jgi:AraC-like DNA-binding protein
MVSDAKSGQKRYHLSFSYIMDPRVFGETLLYQIGRLYCGNGMQVPLHSHLNWFELTIVTDGEGIVQTNGVDVPVSRGDIYLSFPGDFHGIRSDEKNPLKYDFFAFNTVSPELSAEFETLTHTATPAARRIFRDERVRALIADSLAEIDGKGLYANRILSAAFEQILLYVLRGFRALSPARHSVSVGKQEELCYRMMHYIDTHIYTMQGLSDLAEAMQYNYSYLSDLFCKVTSDTLLRYYRTRRLEAAKLLLSEGKLSVGEIADLLHYASIYTFSRAFKEAVGTSPAQYRKRENKSEQVP